MHSIHAFIRAILEAFRFVAVPLPTNTGFPGQLTEVIWTIREVEADRG